MPRIVDCGANIGLATLYFKLHHPAARVLCFEPNPGCFALLKKNVETNQLADVTLVEAACGRENGKVAFFADPEFSPQSSARRGRSARGVACEVKQVRLSDYLDGDVDLLKLDVEG
ncbi:MAG: FkbM family methyltransferase, partial [Mycolicibacterium aromaticivorans]|nr:FkbM family methyltransferase [Mycolicibacterium aromaticivorans]